MGFFFLFKLIKNIARNMFLNPKSICDRLKQICPYKHHHLARFKICLFVESDISVLFSKYN